MLGPRVFHGSAVELSEFLVELAIRKESLSKGVNCSLLVAEWDEDLLLVEASNIVMEWLIATFLDLVEVSREFL